MSPESNKVISGELGLQGRDVDEISFFLSSRRTNMSFHRTRMSADRTLMSIIRTALSMIGFGFTIYQFFRYLRQSVGATEMIKEGAAHNFGIALVALGVVLLGAGIVGHIRFMLDLRTDRGQLASEHLLPEGRFPYSVTLAAALLLLLLGLLAIISMVVRAGPFH
jgi:putative membrane protein